jgi:anaerobic selenocysteine-containing dehydrogenase
MRGSKEVKTLCPYCGVGCGLLATTDGRRLLRVRGDPKHPANFGKLCAKGATVAQTVNVRSRLRYAMVRERHGAAPAVVSPDTGAARAARGLERILQTHGPGAVAFYLSGQLTTESQYLANKFAKACLRTNHVDSNSRLCMASAASGMALSLGSDGPPGCYEDIDLADAFFFIGSNAAECHPVVFERVLARMRTCGARCVVADPRRTRTAEAATVHLPVRPSTDLALLNGLLALWRGWGVLDRSFIAAHTEGWEELDRLLDDYPAARVGDVCGVDEAEFVRAARVLADAPNLITFWTMGVNQSVQGTFSTNAIINLHLATGRIGRPGCGPFSLTGQPNAMGGRDCGYMSHSLPGYRLIADEQHRRQMEQLWGLPAGTIHGRPGYDAVAMFDALDRGELRAIWVIGSNPAATMPNLEKVRRALGKAELVIVQDAYHPTETSSFAHVVLPAAVHFEQDGTFCNSERRVTLMERAVPPPGDAKPDWWWVKQVARQMGFEKGLAFESAAEVFDEFARVTAGRPNDQSGLHHALLRQRGPQQWPFPAMGASAARRYTDRVFPTPSGKARLLARPYAPASEQPDAQFPLVLTTGRTLGQWHTRTKTGHVEALNELDPAPCLRIHPSDAAELGLADGQPVHVTSRRGRTSGTAKVDATLSAGVVFLPIHWNELWAPHASPNEATTDEHDPISKEPALKRCAVSVTAAR